MLNEDQYLERTHDLVAKVRKLREEAEEKMNRFTHVADYDVRYVVGHGPQSAPVADDPASPAEERPKSSVIETPDALLPAPQKDEDRQA